MKITIACVGKLNEDYLREAFAEYEKCLSGRCGFSVTEIADIPAPAALSPAEAAEVRRRESEALYARIRPGSCVIALDEHGELRMSENFAGRLRKLRDDGVSDITFAIGGSLGLHPDALKRSAERLSLSKMTFTHQWARVILAEQLCRAVP